MIDWTEYFKFLATLISIANPIGAIPIFITLMGEEPREGQRRTALLTSLTFGAILLVILIAGEPILRFFGITVASFKIAGGSIIVMMAISMVRARVSPVKHTDQEAKDAADKESVAVVPLGIPLLAGPGAISTVIVYSRHDFTAVHLSLLGGEILLVAVVVWLCLNAAPYIAKFLGKIGINVVTRIMGMILAAIGVEFIAHGLMELFPGLTG